MKTLRILWLLVLSLVLGLAVQAQQRFNNLTILSNLTVNGSATITNLTGSLTNVTVDSYAPKLPNQRQTPYSIYAPTVTNRFILDTATSPFQYNHDATVAFYDGKWFAQWNANTNQLESQPGQILLQSTSTDFVTWTTPAEVFISSATSSNALTMDWVAERQWQPNFVKVGTELWSLWMRENNTGLVYPQGHKLYFSRLTSAASKWQNTELPLNYVENGMTFYGFMTQNPIVLQSGRVLAPLIWQATNQVSPLPPRWSASSGFWVLEKRAGVIYTDDNGATWSVGGVTTLPGANHALWEPVVIQHTDGTIRMFVRNLDYANYSNSQYMLTALGFSDGLAFAPLEILSFDTTSSRLGNVFQPDSRAGRQLYFLNDWRSGGFVTDRRNGAMAFSRTAGADITPGVNFSLSDVVVSYPQAEVVSNKVHVIYSQGNIPRNIKTAVMDPAPDVGTYYLLPRSNDYINPFTAHVAGPPAYFQHASDSLMYAVTNTSSWTATNASVGAWVFRTGNALSEAYVDTREFTPGGGGFVFGAFNNTLLLSLRQAGTAVNWNFNTLTLPTNQWCYVGVTIDPDATGATAYLVNAAGTATTENQALTTHDGFNDGSVVYIGRAQQGSSILPFTGRIRHIHVATGVSASANNHRYWHGLDQSALGVTDWAGTETDPGPDFYDYDAGSADAGTNNEDWLLAWSATGNGVRGSAFAATVDGRTALAITGTGSAGVEMPPFQRGEQLLLGTKLFLTNKTSGFDQVLATIGDRAGQVMILSRTNNPTQVELYSAGTSGYYPLGTYLTNEWVPLLLVFDGNTVTASWNNGAPVSVPLGVQVPTVFYGQGYLESRTLAPADGMAVDVDSTWHHVAPLSVVQNANANPRLLSVLIENNTPSVTLVDSNAEATHKISASDSQMFVNYNSTNVLSLLSDIGELDIYGSAARLELTATAITPAIVGKRAHGSRSNLTPAQSGDVLAAFFGGGYIETNVAGAASGGFLVTATETFSATGKGAEASVQVTPNTTTNRITTWTFNQDGNITHGATAPRWDVVASNNASGLRINVRGSDGINLIRFQTNSITTHTFSGNGAITTLRGTVAQAPPVGTLSYSGSDVTVTAGKGPLQEDTLTAAGNFNLLFTGLATRDAGTIFVWPAATNCTVTLPSYAYGPSGTTLTITGGTGNTNHTEIAWKNLVVGGTNRVSIKALNYYR